MEIHSNYAKSWKRIDCPELPTPRPQPCNALSHLVLGAALSEFQIASNAFQQTRFFSYNHELLCVVNLITKAT